MKFKSSLLGMFIWAIFWGIPWRIVGFIWGYIVLMWISAKIEIDGGRDFVIIKAAAENEKMIDDLADKLNRKG